jgi:hypothetical protein
MTIDHKKFNYFLLGALAITLAGSAYGYAYASGNGTLQSDGTCTCGHDNRPALSEEERAAHEAERIADMASITGLSEDILKAGFDADKNMHDILSENGIDSETVREALRAKADERMKTHMAELVANGTITQEEADERLAHATERGPKGPRDGKEYGPQEGRGHRKSMNGSDSSDNS